MIKANSVTKVVNTSEGSLQILRPISFEVKLPHRGPLFKPKTMQSGSVLFGAPIPSVESDELYSHAWGGMFPGDNFTDLIKSFADGIGVKQAID